MLLQTAVMRYVASFVLGMVTTSVLELQSRRLFLRLMPLRGHGQATAAGTAATAAAAATGRGVGEHLKVL